MHFNQAKFYCDLNIVNLSNFVLVVIFFLIECVKGTSQVCIPFTYKGKTYTDCASGAIYWWCLADGQTGSGSDWSKCGDCVYPSKNINKVL